MNKLSLSQVLPSAGITSSKATASSKLAANEWTGSSRGCHLGWGSGSSANSVCLGRARMLAPVRDSSTLAEKQYTADQPGLAHNDDSSTRDGRPTMTSFWKMEARAALALMILVGVAGSTAGSGGVRAQEAARQKRSCSGPDRKSMARRAGMSMSAT